MEYVITILISLIASMLAWLLQSVLKENHRLKRDSETKHMEEYAALKDAIICMLRDRLIQMHKKYTQQGYISTHGIQNWKAMYGAYIALGGNGMIVHMNEEIDDLRIAQP